ncbi:hypothetical protein ABIB89_003189 [Bradyrhizobium sp. JR3.12]
MPVVKLKCDGCTMAAETVLTTGVPTQRAIALCNDCREDPYRIPESFCEYTVPDFLKVIGAHNGD